MNDTLIIPILNKKIILFQGPPLYLSNEIYIEKISDDEHSAFFRDASDHIKASLDLNSTKCIKIKTQDISNESIKAYRTKSVFVLNIFSESYPIVTTWCGHLNGDNKIRLRTTLEFESLAAINKLSSNQYKVSPTTKRETIISFFAIIQKAITSNPSIYFSMEKYNSSLLRDDFFDKVLDTAICFETLTPGNTELVFRLSQNIAFIVGNSPQERLEVFDNMKRLYDIRSKLVHGDISSKGTDRKIDDIKRDWTVYEKYLKSSMIYYIIFLSQNNKNQWEKHLKELVIGVQNKIV